ncbi:MAG: acyl-CoA thioesterase, partial [Muribaculaceae bacterium]|nr:acyl-CoA thioesterase [Muribaculaceae bacterium]
HYLEHTRHMFCERAGVSFREMHLAGLGPVVRRIEIDYLHPLGLGDTMISKLALQRQGPLFVFRQDIFTLKGEPVVRATVNIVCLEEGRLTRGDKLAEAFKDYI